MITSLVYISTALMIVSKFYETFIQLHHIRDIRFEENPLNQAIMRKMGIKPAIWLMFAFNQVLTIIALIWTINAGSLTWSVVYIAAGVLAAVLQIISARKIKAYCLKMAMHEEVVEINATENREQN